MLLRVSSVEQLRSEKQTVIERYNAWCESRSDDGDDDKSVLRLRGYFSPEMLKALPEVMWTIFDKWSPFGSAYKDTTNFTFTNDPKSYDRGELVVFLNSYDDCANMTNDLTMAFLTQGAFRHSDTEVFFEGVDVMVGMVAPETLEQRMAQTRQDMYVSREGVPIAAVPGSVDPMVRVQTAQPISLGAYVARVPQGDTTRVYGQTG